MIAHKDESIRETKWAEAGRQGHLRCFVNDADVKVTLGKDGSAQRSDEQVPLVTDRLTHSLMPRQVVATI